MSEYLHFEKPFLDQLAAPGPELGQQLGAVLEVRLGPGCWR